jgi:methylmalonyl-CoA/ethylmalonyl-CoA epimerase
VAKARFGGGREEGGAKGGGKCMASSATKIFNLKPHHCGISVPDLEASIAWYRDILGFSLKTRLTLEKADAKIAFMRYGDFQIELFEVQKANPLPDDRRYPNRDLLTHGTKHIAFKVENLEKIVNVLKERGVDIAMDVTKMPDGKTAFIRDNAGILIELLEPISP